MKRSPYSAVLLRYVHDELTGEFVNIGLLLVCPDQEFYKFFVSPRTQRVSHFFPGVRRKHMLAGLAAARRIGNAIARSPGQLLDGYRDEKREVTLKFAHQIVPHDDSAFQWAEPTHGLSSDAEKTFDRLVERLVKKYEVAQSPPKRTDDQVWRTFSRALESRNITLPMETHEVTAKLEKVVFKHALKNGKWHCLEPISFDLVSSESITDKAKRVFGEMTLLRDSSADFCLYLLVGQPGDLGVDDAYDRALQILGEIPGDSRVFPESKADDFAAELERIVANH